MLNKLKLVLSLLSFCGFIAWRMRTKAPRFPYPPGRSMLIGRHSDTNFSAIRSQIPAILWKYSSTSEDRPVQDVCGLVSNIWCVRFCPLRIQLTLIRHRTDCIFSCLRTQVHCFERLEVCVGPVREAVCFVQY